MSTSSPNTFNKPQKLKSTKLIDQLFVDGKALHVFPVKVLYRLSGSPVVPLQATVSVSKRSFKKAVDRNRVKRLLREAYRLQKQPLLDKLLMGNRQMVLFFIYTGKELPNYELVKNAMAAVLNKLVKQVWQPQ